MVRELNRRTFLKITSGSVIGGVAAGSGLVALGRSNAQARSTDILPDRVVPTVCELCFWKCGVLAYVKDEVVYKLEGNPKHPLSNGMLCPRGTGGLGNLYDPDRLKQPLIRTKVDGVDTWRAVSWDEALAHTAERLRQVGDAHGPQSIALYSHGHGGSWFKLLMKAMGSGTVVAPSYDQCRGPRMVGYSLTYGQAVGSLETIDMPNARCVAFIGAHLGENMHNTAVQDVSAANDAGATFITVDPRFSIMASKSKYWLPIKPGTDTALLLAWAHVLIEEKLYDADFVAANTFGFEQLAEHVRDKSPEWAFLETGLDPGHIRATARELARHAPAAFVHPGRHVVWYGNDTQRTRAIAIVNALLGNWGKKGGFYLPETIPVKKFPLPEFPGTRAYEPRKSYPLAQAQCAYDVCDASLPTQDDPQRIKAWIVYGCNVPLTLPNTEKTIEAMQKLDFVVAVDTMPAEVTGYADVVLPENTYLERYDDLHNPPYRRPFVALRQPVVESYAETKPGWWIAKSLAEKMGLDQWFPFDDAEAYLKKRVSSSGMSWEDLVRDGVVVREDAVIYDNTPEMTFNTPTGKIELYSQTMAEAGLPPLPDYEPPVEPPTGYFRLLYGRAPTHTFSRTTNNRQLLEVMPENELWMHTEMARALGLKNGERVMVENQDEVATGPIKLRATERIRQDCVYMVHGFGREDRRLRASFGRGANDSRLITRVARDPVMGGTGMNVNFVTVYRES